MGNKTSQNCGKNNHLRTISDSKSKTPPKNVSVIPIQNSSVGVSSQIIKIALRFWKENITSKSQKDKLEIACSIYCSTIIESNETSHLFKNMTIEQSSLKLLNTIEWLITNNTNTLTSLNTSIRITATHFDAILNAIHETFSYYFPIKYNVEVQYSIDLIFGLASRIISKHDLTKFAHKSLCLTFLKSLHLCLQSNIGKRYLYKYLEQSYCDEIIIFLRYLYRFKAQFSNQGRFIIARSILKNNIQSQAAFSINISYDTRKDIIRRMKEFETIFVSKSCVLCVPIDLFQEAEMELLALIRDNHWKTFVDTFRQFN